VQRSFSELKFNKSTRSSPIFKPERARTTRFTPLFLTQVPPADWKAVSSVLSSPPKFFFLVKKVYLSSPRKIPSSANLRVTPCAGLFLAFQKILRETSRVFLLFCFFHFPLLNAIFSSGV